MMNTSAPGSAVGERPKRVAFVMSNAIGDTLVSMVIVQNLLRSGIEVTVFGRPAYALEQWFPGVEIHPLLAEADSQAALASYDTVLQVQQHEPLPDLTSAHPRFLNLREALYAYRSGCMAERFAEFCRRRIGLSDVDIRNGLTAPPSLRHRQHMRRVAIHPEASREDKRWLQGRFVKLAHRLRELGYDVHFVIAPHERERWHDLQKWRIPAPEFKDLHALACWLYESGWFIGSDSGIGHLASNLNVPTLSLFRRRAVSERWRPAWGTAHVVLPWQWIPTARLKERVWRQTLTCSRVLSAFKRMVREDTHAGSDVMDDSLHSESESPEYLKFD